MSKFLIFKKHSMKFKMNTRVVPVKRTIAVIKLGAVYDLVCIFGSLEEQASSIQKNKNKLLYSILKGYNKNIAVCIILYLKFYFVLK